MGEDVFTFESFVNSLDEKDMKYSSNLIEEIQKELEEEKKLENLSEEEYTDESYDEDILDKIEIPKKLEFKEDNYYKLYKDIAEDFVCDISIEGADPNETEARIVIESNDWTLMFRGSLKNGKCIVPVKKLNILQEGQVGKIRLEVIAEGNLFVPWEDNFKVKVSKKVTVKVNEQRENKTRNGVNVKVRR